MRVNKSLLIGKKLKKYFSGFGGAIGFQSDVAKDGRIDLHLEGDMSSFLSVRYLNNTETGADQEAYIDTLLVQYNMTECNANKVPLKTSVNLDEIAARLPRW